MKTLYLREMGCRLNNGLSDVNNHRVRVIENIDITFQGRPFNMFFEFTSWERYTYRTTNKRTGEPLKKAVKELVNINGIGVDTQFERDEVDERTGRTWQSSWRACDLEKEIYKKNYSFTKKDILSIVNTYAVEKFDKVVLIEEEARRITEKEGGNREKEILSNDAVMEIGHTWNKDHKVVTVVERVKEQTAPNCYRHTLGRSYDVDLETGRICG